MSFAAPGFLLVGLVAGLAIIALHFLTREEPRRYAFPTARFLPESREQAPSRSRRLRDRLILLLRLLALASVALAFARPSFTAARARLVQVVVADRSSSPDTAGVRQEAERVARPGDVTIQVDSGGVSAGLLRGIREARRLRDRSDSVAIVLVTTLTRESFDAATLAIRSQWPGGLTWHRIPIAADSAEPVPLEVRAARDDPVRAALALGGLGETLGPVVRLVRDPALGAADSSWAREAGHVLVHWPAELAPGDSIGGVATRRTVLIAPFARPATVPAGVPIAWWVDGRIAATETRLGSGCLRQVAIPVDPAGDLALRERLRDLMADLLSSCGGPRDHRLADSSTRAALIGAKPAAVGTASLPALPDAGRQLPPWLLAGGILLLLAEQVLRRRTA
jgi:hypothetical protein